MSTSWWRANRAGLLALLLLVPMSVGALTFYAWNEYSRPTQQSPNTVEPGNSVEYAGATWGPATVETIREASLPEGAVAVKVTIPVRPGADMPSCIDPLLIELGGQQREWRNDYVPEASDFENDGPSYCDTDEATPVVPYDLTLTYLIPDDAAPPLALVTYDIEESPSALRFVLDLG